MTGLKPSTTYFYQLRPTIEPAVSSLAYTAMRTELAQLLAGCPAAKQAALSSGSAACRYGDAVAGFAPEQSFRTPPAVGSDATLHVLINADMVRSPTACMLGPGHAMLPLHCDVFQLYGRSCTAAAHCAYSVSCHVKMCGNLLGSAVVTL